MTSAGEAPALQMTPTPTEEEAAAIASAVTAVLQRRATGAGGVDRLHAERERASLWRFGSRDW